MAACARKMERRRRRKHRGKLSGLKTPRAAAIAGIIYAVLIVITTIILKLSMPTDPADAGRWLDESSTRGWIVFALNLVPFAGIAFLWLIGVIRDRIGEQEDRFLATVFLGSGLIYVAMLFASGAIAIGMLNSFCSAAEASANLNTWNMGRDASMGLITVYGMKMGAVFTISSSTIFLKTGVMPRVIPFIGFAVALVLLFLTSLLEWASLLFPAWVLLLSVFMLVATFRKRPEQAAQPETAA